MTLDSGFILDFVMALAACAGTYAAIRSDLARLHERVETALKSAERAHVRIDAMKGG